jgi:hypothetical protein
VPNQWLHLLGFLLCFLVNQLVNECISECLNITIQLIANQPIANQLTLRNKIMQLTVLSALLK